MLYCPECGSKIGKTAKFCRECGCDLRVEETEQVQPNESTPRQKSVQHSSEAIDESVKDNCEQRDLDWLQNFKRQHGEVIQLSCELQSIAKGIPLTPQESENKMSGGVGERLKELQRSFANIEKALISGPKPKSSDLRKMNRSLQEACVYFGIACVAYRKWAEQPSSDIEVYTTERLEKASKYIDKVNEQLELLSNSQSKPIGKCATHPQNDSIGKCADCGIAICTICSAALADVLYCPSCIENVISHTGENESNLTEETSIGTDDNEGEASLTSLITGKGKWARRISGTFFYFLLGGPLFLWARHTIKRNEGRVYSTSFHTSKIDGNQALEHDFWLFNRSNKSIQINGIRIYRSDHNLIQVLNKEDIIRCWGKTEVEPEKKFNGTLNWPIPLKDKTRKKWYVEWNVLDANGAPFTIKECYNIHDIAFAKSRLK